MSITIKRRLAIWFATLQKTAHVAGRMLDRHLTTTAMCVLLTTYARSRAAKYHGCRPQGSPRKDWNIWRGRNSDASGSNV